MKSALAPWHAHSAVSLLRQPTQAAAAGLRHGHCPPNAAASSNGELPCPPARPRAATRPCWPPQARRMYEQCYVATAQGYIFSPELLGKVAADPTQVADHFSAAYLLGLASKIQTELGRALELSDKAGKRLATLSINTELRFTSPEQRAAFTEELNRAIVSVVGRHSSPYVNADGAPASRRPFRLVLGCYPIPPEKELSEPAVATM